MTTLKKPSSTTITESGKICCPIYVGIHQDVAKQILEILRRKIETTEPKTTESNFGLQVHSNSIGDAQKQMESRLRIDLQTLRFVLFDSMLRGVSLDLAFRLQNEVGDELEIITDKMLSTAWKNTLINYKYYAEAP